MHVATVYLLLRPGLAHFHQLAKTDPAAPHQRLSTEDVLDLINGAINTPLLALEDGDSIVVEQACVAVEDLGLPVRSEITKKDTRKGKEKAGKEDAAVETATPPFKGSDGNLKLFSKLSEAECALVVAQNLARVLLKQPIARLDHILTECVDTGDSLKTANATHREAYQKHFDAYVEASVPLLTASYQSYRTFSETWSQASDLFSPRFHAAATVIHDEARAYANQYQRESTGALRFPSLCQFAADTDA